MQRSHVAGDAVLSFHRNCHLRSHTGSCHIGSQLWCHLTFYCYFASVINLILSVRDVRFCHTEMLCFTVEACEIIVRYTHIILGRGKRLNKC